MSRAVTSRTVAWWLTVCVALTGAMILVGGITRLTRSGLSITTWDPILGTLPPLDESDWSEAFARYASSPEGRVRAPEMDLAAFRHIYLVEWGHRLLGRVVALVLLGPMAVFAIRHQLPRAVAYRVGSVLLLGFVQAFLGWTMVRSGLIDVPHVSPYRLAAHFVVGVLLFVVLLWSALDAHARPSKPRLRAPPSIRAATTAAMALAFMLLVWGALMAGHHAGLVFPDFPTMGGKLVPDGTFGRPFAASSFVADAVTVHFVHRTLALLLLVVTGVVVGIAFRRGTPARVRWLVVLIAGAVVGQITLGAATVIAHVPIVLASFHQAGALVVVASLTALQRELRGEVEFAAL